MTGSSPSSRPHLSHGPRILEEKKSSMPFGVKYLFVLATWLESSEARGETRTAARRRGGAREKSVLLFSVLLLLFLSSSSSSSSLLLLLRSGKEKNNDSINRRDWCPPQPSTRFKLSPRFAFRSKRRPITGSLSSRLQGLSRCPFLPVFLLFLSTIAAATATQRKT